MKSVMLVGIGGALGSILRYLMGTSINKFYHGHFPMGTFVVNIIGCILIGLITAIIIKQNIINSDLKMLLIVGFCGGFTTFSTFSQENIQLINSGHFSILALNIIASVSLGVLGVWAGLNIIK